MMEETERPTTNPNAVAVEEITDDIDVSDRGARRIVIAAQHLSPLAGARTPGRPLLD